MRGRQGAGAAGLPAMVSGRRAHGWEGATVPGTGSPDTAGGGGHTVALWRLVAPAGPAGAGGSRRAGPDRQLDTGAPRGRAGTRHRSPAALVRARGVGGRLRTLPGRAGAGAGGDDGQDSTAHRRGRCGTPAATPAGETTDALLGRQGHGLPALVVGVLVAAADLAIRDREQTAIGQCDPVDIPAQVMPESAPCGARPVGRRRPTPWSRPTRESAGRAVPAAPAPETDHESASRGPGQVPRRTSGPAATRFDQPRPHRPGPGRARADGRPRYGARCAAHTTPRSARRRRVGPRPA